MADAEGTALDVRSGPLWRDRRFVTVWTAQGVSELGDRISALALPLAAVTVLDAGATEVALLTAAVWLPNVLAMVVGSWVDRRPDRRRLLVVSDLGRALVALSVPVAAVLGVLTLPQLFVVALLLGGWSVVFRSAWQPFFVALVRRDQYVEANSLFSATRSGSLIAGPVVGGGLVQALTAPYALVVDAVSFLVSAGLLGRVRVEERPPEPDRCEPLGQRVVAGMRHVLHDPYLAPILRCVTWVNFFTLLVNALVVVYASRDLGLSAGMIGLAFGVGAAGGLVGALVAGRTARRFGTGRTAALGAVLFTAPLAAIPLAHGPDPRRRRCSAVSRP
jgi:MFS family permease